MEMLLGLLTIGFLAFCVAILAAGVPGGALIVAVAGFVVVALCLYIEWRNGSLF